MQICHKPFSHQAESHLKMLIYYIFLLKMQIWNDSYVLNMHKKLQAEQQSASSIENIGILGGMYFGASGNLGTKDLLPARVTI